MQHSCNLPHPVCDRCATVISSPENQKPSVTKQLTHYLNMITRIALGAIAIMTSATLFTPFFLLGMGLGLYYHHYSKSVSHGHDIVGCGQGFMESMANMHFPAEVSLIANLGVTVCHIDHHPIVFVPYTAVALGMWAGQIADQALTKAYQWLRPDQSQLTPCHV